MAFTVAYNANGATSGSAPIDNQSYSAGATVTVLGAGGLGKSPDVFAYWNTAAAGSGTVFGVGATFTITDNVTLFAQWYTTQGLADKYGLGAGVTKHYTFTYDRALGTSGLEPARTNAVIDVCESDYQQMSSWFGGIEINPTVAIPFPMRVANLGGGAATGGTFPNISTTLKPGNGNATLIRYLIVAEIVEVLMDAQHQGWSAPDYSNEQSCGEALSRFLSQQFLILNGLGVSEPGYAISGSWLNSSLPTSNASSSQLGNKLTTLAGAIDATSKSITVASAPTIPFETSYIVQVDNEQMLVTAVDTGTNTLTVTRGYNATPAVSHADKTSVLQNYGARSDYVNTTLEYDHGIDAATGCAMLFLYYLNVQLGFSIKQIVAAAPGNNNAATCLRGVYQNLTNDSSDPFPFFKLLLDTAFPPDKPANILGPNPDNPWPIGILQFWGGKYTWGHDEVSDIINTAGGIYPDAFWLMLTGFNRQVAGSATPSAPTVAFPGTVITLDPEGIEYESDNLLAPQRIRYPYDAVFTAAVLSAFPPKNEKVATITTAMNLLGGNFPATSEFFFTAGADPYFTNVLPNPNPQNDNAPYLSNDLRVFTAVPGLNPTLVPGAPAFASDSIAGAYSYIQGVIGWLNQNHGDPSKPDPFDPANNIIPEQQAALSGDSSVNPSTLDNNQRYNNYNFAVARVRLQGSQGSSGQAIGVKVFFRLWGTQTADTDWNPASTYLSHKDGNGNPLWPLAPSNNHTIPFFATSNSPNFTDPNNPEYGTNGVNNQTITIKQSDAQWAYFGCFLNLYDDNFVVNGVDVKKTYPGTHHCLVAEIAYASAPIENVGNVTVTPETSSQLAQRNLQVTPSDNPGPPSSHRIPQTFDARPSSVEVAALNPLGYPDELMIDWGEVPAGSVASIYWPGVAASEVLALARRFYSVQSLTQSDPHTIRCCTLKGVTYVPIPFGDGDSLAGLITVDLPPAVTKGQEFKVVVRRVSNRRMRARQAPPPPPPPQFVEIELDRVRTMPQTAAVEVATLADRYIVGSFEVRIPVDTASAILPGEEDTLAILKARLNAMSPSNRWYPVLLRYTQFISNRVHGLGGNPAQIPASFGGAPIAVIAGAGGERHREAERYTGKISDLFFDDFGDFDGFALNTGRHEYRFFSRERGIYELVERAWFERLRITVTSEPHRPRQIKTIIIHEPPTDF